MRMELKVFLFRSIISVNYMAKLPRRGECGLKRFRCKLSLIDIQICDLNG